MWVYGDSIAHDDTLEYYNEYAEEEADVYGELAWKRDSGDDLIKVGSYGTGNLYVVGGYGDDKIFSGADR